MSFWIIGTMAVTGTVKAVGTNRQIGRQIDDLDDKKDAYNTQAIQTRNAFESRYSQTEHMHSNQIEALKKTKTLMSVKLHHKLEVLERKQVAVLLLILLLPKRPEINLP